MSQIDAVNKQIRTANQAIQQIKASVPPPFVDSFLKSKGLPSNEIPSVPTSVPQERADATIHFPQFLIVGYSFRPTPDWNLEFNADWTDWDSLNTVVLHEQGKNQNTDLPFNWKSSCFYEFGATRKFSNGLRLSGGYIYSVNSVPDSQFNPGIPDSNRHIWSVGVGLKREQLSCDLGYQFAYGPTRTVNNGTVADGTYTFFSHAITFSCQYDF